MDDSTPDVWIVPTEMARRDIAWEILSILGYALAVWWFALEHLPVLPLIPVGVLAGVWILTGEGAADVPYVGGVAGPLRARIGHRRAHEWMVVGAHYWCVGPWPRLVHLARVKGAAGWAWLRSIRVRTWR